jgi:flagellar hook-associated protein 3 FlgL
MTLRITLQTLANDAVADTRKQNDLLARLQEQASTGKQLTAPSDDPARAAAIESSTIEDNRLGSYLSNIATVRGTLDSGVSALQQASDLLLTARSLAVEAGQSSSDPSAREAEASQIDSLLGQLTSLANTQVNGDYVFSGTATRTQPFVVTATDGAGRPTQISYQGSVDQSETITGPGQAVNPYVAGNDAFGNGSGAEPPGTPNIFQTLMSIRDTLRDPGVSDAQSAQTISAKIADLDQAHNRMLRVMGSQSAMLQGLDGLESHLQDLQLTTKKVESSLGDADLSETIVRLQQQNLQVQLSYEGITRLFNQSLLDFLK